ncbi:hypothetical protein LTR84_007561 [Exophiala bonariae]|uniref:C2H2-type domain-containing protein n=1 Tax=Exophiala bonariae TaxID=1690606 RepID=A0AAV9NPJ3_9EURO|nr:hypothetical protein LTR84_007561 [Exophiala bonariae]
MRVNTSLPQQRQNFHRRGQSFDQQRSPIRKHHHGSTVSITDIGQFHGQQILREAQQQRIPRPGQQHQQQHPQHQQFQQNQMNMSIDMPISPACGMFQMPNSLPGTPYENMTMNEIMHQNSQSLDFSQTQPYYSDMNMPVSNIQNMGIMDENNAQYFQDNHVLQIHPTTGISFDNRRMSQPDLRVQTQLRPHTPSNQIQTAQFPLTPPVSHHNSHVQYSRSLQASPALQSPYPIPMARGRSLQGIIEHDESRQDFLATPAGTSFELAEMPVPEPRGRRQTPPPHRQLEPAKVKTEQAVFNEALDFSNDDSPANLPNLDINSVPVLTSDQIKSGSSSPTRLALSPRRMSISDLNLEPGIEASIEETNVTLDDIAQYIEGPDGADNKWICKFEGCNKKFGRKENIKSHVQTHLGDRQFRCDHCKKCFVRGHDLKRHAKIHTGTKPYPCLCGNSFARHDALTRHRQRGMCIGAFDGVVKKVIKRGRPKKHRPEMDERLDKADRTRQKIADFQDNYTSSASSCSISSWGSPPTENFESLSIRGSSPYESMPLFAVAPNDGTLDPMMSFPPDNFSFTPPASPGFSTGNKPSPNYRELTPAELGDLTSFQTSTSSQMLPELPAMDQGLPMMTMVGGLSLPTSGQSLPSLSHSSSSPAADVVVFDFSDQFQSGLPSSANTSQLPMKLEERNEFDTFLDYGSLDMGLDASSQDFFANLS